MSEKESITEQSVVSVNAEANKKRKRKFIIGGILVLIAIAIGLYIGYQKLNSNPASIYRNTINDIYNELSSALKDAKENSFSGFDLENEPISMDIEAKLDTDMEELKSFSGLTYNLNLGLDYANEKAYVGAGIKESSSTIISGILSYVNKNAYVKCDELFNKVLHVGEYDLFEQLSLEIDDLDVNWSYDNFEYILKAIKDITINSLDESKFTIENEKITINNKEYNAKKVIYDLDEENMKRTNKFFTDSILNDEKLLQAISEITGLTVDEVKEEIEASEDYNIFSSMKVILYTDGFNNVIAGSIYEGENQIVKFDNVDKLNLTITSDEDSIIINEIDDYVKITCIDNDEEIITLKIYEDGKKVDYELNVEGTKVTGTIEVNNINKLENNRVSADFKFSVSVSILGEEINISLDGSISVAKEMNDVLDTTNSIEITELSDDEINQMYIKLNSLLERFELTDLISNF